ncbi:MAG TPA: recombinase family protein [Gemmataceae bacterium]|jgi:DNA invertase Pin-like site-specific DNA recombinase
MASFDPPLQPRSGCVLHGLTFTRIRTTNQDIRSNDDQKAYCQRHLLAHYDSPIQWHFNSGQGSGEYLDRKELREAEEMVESGRIDVIIVEDLARICRRSRAFDFCELCEDNDCRLYSAREEWTRTRSVSAGERSPR